MPQVPDLKNALPPETVAVIATAGRIAAERNQEAYLAGGLVRDLFLGVGTVDLDLVVVGDGPGFARRLAEALGAEVEVYGRFLTATVTLADLTRLDVATARTETYERPGALPAVKPSASLAEDLKRRDLTINAMAVALAPERFGVLVDPFGGADDLAAKRVRLLHARSLFDDPTRLLRMARYAGRFGLSLEPATAGWVGEALAGRVLEFVSGDRLRQEVLLALHEPEPAAAFALLQAWKALDAVVPGADPGDEFPALSDAAANLLALVEKGASWEPGLVGLLLLLRGAQAGEVARAAGRLGAAGRTRTVLMRAPEAAPLARKLEAASRPSEAAGLLAEVPLELALAAIVLARGENARKLGVGHLAQGRFLRSELKGDDLCSMGFAPGPALGRMLAALRSEKLDGGVPDRAAEEAWIKEHYRPPHGEGHS